MKRTVDYSSLKGFNYTQSNSLNDRDFWARYDHSIVDRDLGYAERLHLNSVRIFMDISMYRSGPQRFLSNIRDFVRTAWEHGISTNPILFMGFRFRDDELTWEEMNAVEGLKPLTKTIEDPSCWHIGEEYVEESVSGEFEKSDGTESVVLSLMNDNEISFQFRESGIGAYAQASGSTAVYTGDDSAVDLYRDEADADDQDVSIYADAQEAGCIVASIVLIHRKEGYYAKR